MKSWNSSPHPISDIRDWFNNHRLEIQPDFQRKEVWSEAARIMLIDTILRQIPMPKVFVSSVLLNGNVHRIVVDGQQRISAIMSFLKDEFSLAEPYSGPYRQKLFSELPIEEQNRILQYRIDFNEAIEYTEAELREIYSRLNKYSIALTKQELRRADFPGNFLELAEELATNEFLEESRIFSIANRRRLADVEYISELLAGLIDGPQEKKASLDSFYMQYANWQPTSMNEIKTRFLAAAADIQFIFDPKLSLYKTRFRQKADFYSLLLAIDALKSQGYSIAGKEIIALQEDFKILDEVIEPESIVRDCRTYAIRCVSQANTVNSRKWRQGFLQSILLGTYANKLPIGDSGRLFFRLLDDMHNGDPICPAIHSCAICGEDVSSSEDYSFGWPKEELSFQLSNACIIHSSCSSEESTFNLLQVVDSEKEPLFADDAV